jgi:hypothetical protein
LLLKTTPCHPRLPAEDVTRRRCSFCCFLVSFQRTGKGRVQKEGINVNPTDPSFAAILVKNPTETGARLDLRALSLKSRTGNARSFNELAKDQPIFEKNRLWISFEPCVRV